MSKKQIDYSQKGYTKPKEHFIYRVKFTKGEEVKIYRTFGHYEIVSKSNQEGKIACSIFTRI